MIDNPHNYTKEDMVNYIVSSLEMDTLLFHSNVSIMYFIYIYNLRHLLNK